MLTNAKIIGSIGLCFDIVGAVLVANEVVRIFCGPLTLDEETVRKMQGGKGSTVHYGSAYKHVINPDFEIFEKKKRTIMRIGLYFLIAGFILQIFSLWI